MQVPLFQPWATLPESPQPCLPVHCPRRACERRHPRRAALEGRKSPFGGTPGQGSVGQLGCTHPSDGPNRRAWTAPYLLRLSVKKTAKTIRPKKLPAQSYLPFSTGASQERKGVSKSTLMSC